MYRTTIIAKCQQYLIYILRHCYHWLCIKYSTFVSILWTERMGHCPVSRIIWNLLWESEAWPCSSTWNPWSLAREPCAIRMGVLCLETRVGPPLPGNLGPLAWLGDRHTINRKPCKRKKKKSHRMFEHMYEVLNEVYLQNFLYGWDVNRETNLMNILNPWFATVILQ